MRPNLFLPIALYFLVSCAENKDQNNEIIINKPKISMQNTMFQLDTNKSLKSFAILEARLISYGAGDKYVKDSFEVIQVIENKTTYVFPKAIEVYRYSFKQGIPENKKCIVYLTAYPFGSTELNNQNEWMLLDGDGAYACECK